MIDLPQLGHSANLLSSFLSIFSLLFFGVVFCFLEGDLLSVLTNELMVTGKCYLDWSASLSRMHLSSQLIRCRFWVLLDYYLQGCFLIIHQIR